MFRDAQGREWAIPHITVTVLRRVRDMTKFDLWRIGEPAQLTRLANDPILLADVLYSLCKPQADAWQVDDASFGQLLCGDVIEDATNAMLEAMVDFFPNPTRRTAARRVLAATKRAQTEQDARLQQRIESGDLDRLVAEAMEKG